MNRKFDGRGGGGERGVMGCARVRGGFTDASDKMIWSRVVCMRDFFSVANGDRRRRICSCYSGVLVARYSLFFVESSTKIYIIAVFILCYLNLM